MTVRITRHFVTVGGRRVHYTRAGSGPAIVLVHGLGGNHAVWFQQVAHFATDRIGEEGFNKWLPGVKGF